MAKSRLRSGGDGRYAFTDLAKDIYEIRVSSLGYLEQVRRMKLDKDEIVDFKFEEKSAST